MPFLLLLFCYSTPVDVVYVREEGFPLSSHRHVPLCSSLHMPAWLSLDDCVVIFPPPENVLLSSFSPSLCLKMNVNFCSWVQLRLLSSGHHSVLKVEGLSNFTEDRIVVHTYTKGPTFLAQFRLPLLNLTCFPALHRPPFTPCLMSGGY